MVSGALSPGRSRLCFATRLVFVPLEKDRRVDCTGELEGRERAVELPFPIC